MAGGQARSPYGQASANMVAPAFIRAMISRSAFAQLDIIRPCCCQERFAGCSSSTSRTVFGSVYRGRSGDGSRGGGMGTQRGDLYADPARVSGFPRGSAFCPAGIAVFYLVATVESAVRYWSGRGGEWKGRVQDTH